MPAIPKQETFDRVVAHLRKQGRRSVRNDSDGCTRAAYRGLEGDKCPVGELLPEEAYLPCFEGIPADPQSVTGLIVAGLGHDVHLVGEMQTVHDGAEQRYWEYFFERVARRHHLTYTPPAEAATTPTETKLTAREVAQRLSDKFFGPEARLNAAQPATEDKS